MRLVQICIILVLTSICGNLHADDSTTVEIRQVGARTWIHTSYEIVNGYRTDSNGLVVGCSAGMILVDTCWNDTQTHALRQRIEDLFHKPIILAIITHAHSDRIGGIRELVAAGIKVVSTAVTAKYAVNAGYPAPTKELDLSITDLQLGDIEVETFYPGPGHTKDNIVVWIPMERVLFGGCLVKAMSSNNLGNIADADIQAWGPSAKNLKERYPLAMFVIPGHGQVGGIELLQHTIDLCLKK